MMNVIAKKLVERIKSDARSDSVIARMSGVSQPTVSRLRASQGDRVRMSRAFIKLCNIYDISIDEMKGGRAFNEILCSAIIDVWDGTETHARALLLLLQGIKSLHR